MLNLKMKIIFTIIFLSLLTTNGSQVILTLNKGCNYLENTLECIQSDKSSASSNEETTNLMINDQDLNLITKFC